jgi:hypothetical protein
MYCSKDEVNNFCIEKNVEHNFGRIRTKRVRTKTAVSAELGQAVSSLINSEKQVKTMSFTILFWIRLILSCFA